MSDPRTYPPGVPSWIETGQPDLDGARRFYGELFGWTFETVTPRDAPSEYVIARLGGQDAAGLSSDGDPGWHTYIAVADADASATLVAEAGGRVLAEPTTAPAGRAARCADPAGARFRLWQAGRRLGAQVVNQPGAWNFSDLHTGDPAAARAFYPEVFGWSIDDLGFATLLRVPGYGDHLESTVDPGIRARQRGGMAPPGFEDAIGWVAPPEAGTTDHWHVSFTVADRDAAVEAGRRLGAEILATEETQWTRTALIRDPQGAVFTASQFAPPA
jgi:uncharacterized protein